MPLTCPDFNSFVLTVRLQRLSGRQEIVEGLAVGVAVAPLALPSDVISGFIDVRRTPGIDVKNILHL